MARVGHVAAGYMTHREARTQASAATCLLERRRDAQGSTDHQGGCAGTRSIERVHDWTIGDCTIFIFWPCRHQNKQSVLVINGGLAVRAEKV